MISFILWEKVLKMIRGWEKNTFLSTKTILIIKSAFKNGLSLPLKQAFPDIEPEAIPELVNHILIGYLGLLPVMDVFRFTIEKIPGLS